MLGIGAPRAPLCLRVPVRSLTPGASKRGESAVKAMPATTADTPNDLLEGGVYASPVGGSFWKLQGFVVRRVAFAASMRAVQLAADVVESGHGSLASVERVVRTSFKFYSRSPSQVTFAALQAAMRTR